MISKIASQSKSGASLSALGLGALGVVFGDIGTSPLYTLKTVLALAGGKPDRMVALGSLSLIIWTLIIVTTVKYVSVAMRIDHDGEGGILALMSLLAGKMKPRPVILTLGLVGAALIYGDGAVTPAISVLSAVEGLKMVTPSVAPYVLPSAVVILIALFFIQSQGTERIGKTFGPIMLAWFVTMALLGIKGILQHPAVLMAINPWYGFTYLRSGGLAAFLVLGGVFLCVTGAEALYADMGHFGPRPIRLAWLALVFPSLILNYAGQAALVLNGGRVSDNIFFQLCPAALLIPMIVLSTVATIIASQSIITGAFSMTRQAIQLGWLPRLNVTQTSAEGYGQIYIGSVNWILMVVTCALALVFRKSDNLAAAYGIAVSATMLATSALLFVAMREIWRWNLLQAGAAAGVFILIDATFFASNLSKFASGGYVPLLLGGLAYGTMLVWHAGAKAVSVRLHEGTVPFAGFAADLARKKILRVPGTGIFMTRTDLDIPPVMAWHVSHSQSLHERILVLTVQTAAVPWINDQERFTFKEAAPQFWRLTARYGYMERPDIPALLQQALDRGCGLDLSEVTYYVGHETILSREDRKGLPRWGVACFAMMQRNTLHLSDYFRLPSAQVVEIGRQISI